MNVGRTQGVSAMRGQTGVERENWNSGLRAAQYDNAPCPGEMSVMREHVHRDSTDTCDACGAYVHGKQRRCERCGNCLCCG